MTESESFFIPEGDRFRATEHTRGPWSPDHQHGGPPGALLVREIERVTAEAAAAGGATLRPGRILVEFIRPVPIASLAVRVEDGPGGRQVARRTASLLDPDGVCVARASALLIREKEVALPELPPPRGASPKPPEACEPFTFPFFSDVAGYHRAVEVRIAAGTFGAGPVTGWFRMRHRLLPDEEPSGWQRVVIAADSGNGISIVCDPSRYLFINPDLGVFLHRVPEGEWVALEAESILRDDGLGLAESRLHDEGGPIGRSCQSLLVDVRR